MALRIAADGDVEVSEAPQAGYQLRTARQLEAQHAPKAVEQPRGKSTRMNRIGGRSNTGEGGEDPDRYRADGSSDSAIYNFFWRWS